DRDHRPAALPLRRAGRGRGRPGAPLRREAAARRLGQRRLLRLPPQGLRLPRRRRLRARARAARAAGGRRPGRGLPAPGLLLRDGHLPRVPRPERLLEQRQGALEGVGMSDLARAFAGRGVLVTGHTGFKGSWLCLWLAELGAEVHGYALPPPTRPSLYGEARVREVLASETTADVRDTAALAAAVAKARP